MSTLPEIESAAEKLSCAQQEELIRFLTIRLQQRSNSPQLYRTRTHPGRVRDEIVPDKLGQLPDNFT